MTRQRREHKVMPTPDHRVALEGHVKTAIETGRNRLLVGACLFTLAFGAVGVRLLDVATNQNGAEPTMARGDAVTRPTTRADIVDRNGILLATSLATQSLYADPQDILDVTQAANAIASVFPDLNATEIAHNLKLKRRFVWIKRDLTPNQQKEINSLGIPGLYFQREERRVYPQGSLTAHVVGFSSVDDEGISGIEKSFDEVLKGQAEPLPLSIDVRAQHIMREELQRQIDEFSGIGGAGIILDARTSETLAMVSLPDFNPNHAGNMPADTRFNRASLGVYEMGSTFKIFNTAMALDAGKTSMHDGYDASKPIRIARFTINDYHAKNRWLSVPEIFMYSSNIGSVKMALDVGTKGQRDFMSKIGFLRPTAVELPESGTPMVPSPWRQINTMTISFGHGIAVSPIHLANGVASMVNGGIKRPATVLKHDLGNMPAGTRVIRDGTSKDVRRLLRLVVANGTGRKAAAEGYLVGGKTGTAEKQGGRGGYRKKSLLSSFVAAFPMNDPKYIVLVMVDEPKGTKKSFGYATGGWVAAPAVKRVIERVAPLFGIHPIDEKSPEIRRDLMVQLPSNKGGKRLASF